MPLERLCLPGNKPELTDILRRANAGEHVVNRELEQVRQDGSRLEVALTVSPLQRLVGGTAAGFSIIARDITLQKRAEEKVRASEAFYHSLVEYLPQNIFRKDINSQFTFANQRFCQTLGKTLKEIVGKNDYDFFPADLAAKYQADDRQVIESGQLLETVEVNQPPDGRKLYVQVCKMPVYGALKRIIGVQCIFWDITNSREAEIALRHSEERYRELLGSVTDYIYTVEIRAGRPVTTHHGPGCLNVTGYAPEDYEKDPFLWYRMIHQEDREAVLRQSENILRGEALPLEHRILHRDGSVRWVRNTPVPRYDEQRRLVAYDGLIADITARKVAEEHLRQALVDLNKSHEELKLAQNLLMHAEKMETVGRLAAGVAHEVKNPLAILLSGMEFLRTSTAAQEESTHQVLEDMGSALKRADSVIHGLLDFAAAQELGVKSESLNNLIDSTLALLRHDLSRGRVEVSKELMTELPLLQLDRNKIEQVFLNLFINSLHAMANGGTLHVLTRVRPLQAEEVVWDAGSRVAERFRPGDRVVEVLVEDTGTGIAPDKLSKIFEPFFTTKPTGQGTGLGLAVTRKILELHGATIRLTNRNEGGVCATLWFRNECVL